MGKLANFLLFSVINIILFVNLILGIEISTLSLIPLSFLALLIIISELFMLKKFKGGIRFNSFLQIMFIFLSFYYLIRTLNLLLIINILFSLVVILKALKLKKQFRKIRRTDDFKTKKRDIISELDSTYEVKETVEVDKPVVKKVTTKKVTKKATKKGTAKKPEPKEKVSQAKKKVPEKITKPIKKVAKKVTKKATPKVEFKVEKPVSTKKKKATKKVTKTIELKEEVQKVKKAVKKKTSPKVSKVKKEEIKKEEPTEKVEKTENTSKGKIEKTQKVEPAKLEETNKSIQVEADNLVSKSLKINNNSVKNTSSIKLNRPINIKTENIEQGTLKFNKGKADIINESVSVNIEKKEFNPIVGDKLTIEKGDKMKDKGSTYDFSSTSSTFISISGPNTRKVKSKEGVKKVKVKKYKKQEVDNNFHFF